MLGAAASGGFSSSGAGLAGRAISMISGAAKERPGESRGSRACKHETQAPPPRLTHDQATRVGFVVRILLDHGRGLRGAVDFLDADASFQDPLARVPREEECRSSDPGPPPTRLAKPAAGPADRRRSTCCRRSARARATTALPWRVVTAGSPASALRTRAVNSASYGSPARHPAAA